MVRGFTPNGKTHEVRYTSHNPHELGWRHLRTVYSVQEVKIFSLIYHGRSDQARPNRAYLIPQWHRFHRLLPCRFLLYIALYSFAPSNIPGSFQPAILVLLLDHVRTRFAYHDITIWNFLVTSDEENRTHQSLISPGPTSSAILATCDQILFVY